jgi:uncharacterized membrane protein YphA (DoxX/SURF4 family)
MSNFDFINQPFAFALARVILGVLIFMQGYEKVFKIRMRAIVNAYELPINRSFIFDFFIWGGTIYTSYCELICGPLLFLGLFTNFALYLFSIDMVIAVMGMSLQEAMWDMKFVWSRLVLTIFLLLCPSVWNSISLDHFIFVK